MTAESWPSYEAAHPDARFTEWLGERAGDDWSAATEHRFVGELADGSLADDVFRRYLVQDHAFVATLVRVVGYAVGQAPTPAARQRLTGFLSTLTGEEDDYFDRAFDALAVPERDRTNPDRTPVTAAFEDLLLRGALEGGYAATLAVIVPVEWVYLTWARAADEAEVEPSAFYHREWIDLHVDPDFASFVAWLRTELDEVGPGRPGYERDRLDRLFTRAVRLEVDFFEEAYS